MRCGGCESAIDMPCETAQNHARECSENHITCPLLNNDLMLSQCTQSMSVSALWEHCQQFHTNAPSHAVAMVNAEACENNWMSATMSVSLTFERNHYSYFTITTPTNQYNMCVHVTREVCDVIRTDPKILLCVRRFFPETELTFHRKIISLEIGSICGMILPIPDVVSAYEDLSSLKKLETAARALKIIEVPLSIFSQMQQYDEAETTSLDPAAFPGTALTEPSPVSRVPLTKVKLTLSVQFWFQEHKTRTIAQSPLLPSTDTRTGTPEESE